MANTGPVTVDTKPHSERPPPSILEDALQALPGILNPLAKHRVGQPENARDCEFNSLLGALIKAGHGRDTAEWAIHEHVEAKRLEAIPGSGRSGVGFVDVHGVGGIGGHSIFPRQTFPQTHRKPGIYDASPSTPRLYSLDKERCFIRWTDAMKVWWHNLDDPIQSALEAHAELEREAEKERELSRRYTEWENRAHELNVQANSAFQQLANSPKPYAVVDLHSRFLAVVDSLKAWDYALETECPQKPHWHFNENGKWPSQFTAFQALSHPNSKQVPPDARLLASLILLAKDDPSELRKRLEMLIIHKLLAEAMEWVSFIGKTKYGLQAASRNEGAWLKMDVPPRTVKEVEWVETALRVSSFTPELTVEIQGQGGVESSEGSPEDRVPMAEKPARVISENGIGVKAVRSNPRGPKRIDRTNDKRILEAWNTGRYPQYVDLARELGTTAKEVGKVIDRNRPQRRK